MYLKLQNNLKRLGDLGDLGDLGYLIAASIEVDMIVGGA